ncbi:MAG: glycosyltransferase family 39 protein [Ruminococcaceae bacterium]|nr:glycosyltransferase family 39 protein [Oscillospiraceae bacterium]
MKKHGSISGQGTRLEYAIRIMVCILVCVFLLFAIIGNASGPHNSGAGFVTVSAATAAMLWFLYGFCEKTQNAYKPWLILIFLAAFVSRLIMLSSWPIEPSSDFKSTYDAALALANANISEIEELLSTKYVYYYSIWPVHLPFILLETAIIKISGEGYYAIQVIFNIFSSLSCVIAAIIAKTLYGKRAGIITGIVMAFLPTRLMYSPVLSNQHIASFFFLAAIYVSIEKPIKHRLVNVALAAVCATVSQLMRPEMLIFIIAIMCYFIYKYILSTWSKERAGASAKKVIGYEAVFWAIYLFLMSGVSFLIATNGYVEKNITSGNYKYKVAVGLNAESNGRWNEADSQLAYDEVALDGLIKERTQNKLDLVVLGAKKIMHQYGTYNYDWCIEAKTGNFARKWHEPLTNGTMLVILLLCFFKVIMSIYNKSRREVLLLVTMLGYFLIYTVIEVQNRYNYFMIPIFVIFASGALEQLYGYAQMYIEKRK